MSSLKKAWGISLKNKALNLSRSSMTSIGRRGSRTPRNDSSVRIADVCLRHSKGSLHADRCLGRDQLRDIWMSRRARAMAHLVTRAELEDVGASTHDMYHSTSFLASAFDHRLREVSPYNSRSCPVTHNFWLQNSRKRSYAVCIIAGMLGILAPPSFAFALFGAFTYSTVQFSVYGIYRL